MRLIIENGLFTLPTDELARAEGCYLDLALPEKIIHFCRTYCKITSDDFSGKAGRPFAPIEWQAALIRTIYSWRNKAGGFRFKRCHCQIPRRQGKSLLVSALCVFQMLAAKRAEVYIIASTIEQAKIIFDRVCDFIKASPQLSKRLWLRDHIKTIEDRKNGSKLKILSSNKTGKSGLAASLICADEFCEWPSHSARDVWNKIYDSGADRDCIVFCITTPQYDLEHLGREKYLEAKAVLDGHSQDTTLLPIIYEAPDNWRDDLDAAITIACPSADLTVPRSYYHNDWRAIKDNPSEVYRFETTNMGRWSSNSPTIWIPANVWATCATSRPESDFYGRQAILGIDASKNIALTSYVVIIEEHGNYYCYPRAFLPGDCAAAASKRDHVPYSIWAANPLNRLYFTPGDIMDEATIIQHIRQDAQTFRIKQIRYDAWGMESMRQKLQAYGYECIGVNSGKATMSPAYIHMERLVKEQKLKHPDNVVFNWCLANCVPHLDNREHLMIEPGSSIQRVDIVDATAIGLTYFTDDKQRVPVAPPGQQWICVV